MNECGSSKQQLMTLYKQLNYDVVSNIKLWKDQNLLLYQKIIDCCETTNGNLSDIADILDEYIIILSDCCRTINGNLTLILEGAGQICIECVHLPVTTTTTEECEPGTTEEPDITTEEPTYTTGEPGPEECDQPTEFHDKGTFYPYMVEKFVGPDTGMVTLDYDTYDIPDRFIVMFGGVAVIDTGYHGNPIFEPRLNAALALRGVAPVSVNASQVGQASFIKSTAEDHAYVLVYAPLRNTAFNFILSCPGPYTTTTSEEEEVTTTSEEQTPTTTEVEVVTTTSEEQVLTTTGEPCLLDIEVLYPPQPESTTTSSEEPITTTTSTLEIVTTTSEEPVTTTTEPPITTTTTEYIPDAFIFEVQVGAETIALPLLATDDDGNAATHNFNVYWDWENHPETSELISNTTASHTYTTPGFYVVVVEGICQTFATRSKTSSTTHAIAGKITRVLRWGTVADFKLLNFYGCINLTELPHDVTEEPYAGSDGTITGATNINTFENFLYSCILYTKPIAERLFWECPGVTTYKYTFALSGVTGNIPDDLFNYTGSGAIVSFESTFEHTELGSGGLFLYDYLFYNNPNAVTFKRTFYETRFTTQIPAELFQQNTIAEDFTQTFACSVGWGLNTYWKSAVPSILFDQCTSALYFTGTFQASGITGIDEYMFWSNPAATHFNYTFQNCRGLTVNVLSNKLFEKNTLAKTFAYCFSECQNLSDKITDVPYLFRYAGTSVTGTTYNDSFAATFEKCGSLWGTIPVELFSWNTNAQCFYGTFRCAGGVWGSLSGEIPADLFINNTKATTFRDLFRQQFLLELAPNGLFRANTLVSGITCFRETFYACNKLVVEPFVFSGTTLVSTQARFAGKAMDFQQCFEIGGAGYSGASKRCAPEIWDDVKYPALSKAYITNCFGLCSTSSYENYECIPATWGGTGYDAGICATISCADPV